MIEADFFDKQSVQAAVDAFKNYLDFAYAYDDDLSTPAELLEAYKAYYLVYTRLAERETYIFRGRMTKIYQDYHNIRVVHGGFRWM